MELQERREHDQLRQSQLTLSKDNRFSLHIRMSLKIDLLMLVLVPPPLPLPLLFPPFLGDVNGKSVWPG
jgi:hypothetical protein